MTIFALSTGPGLSGLAVIRISGPDCKNVLKKLTGSSELKPRQATLKKINNVDGFLVGGASQNSKNFIDIIKKTFN